MQKAFDALHLSSTASKQEVISAYRKLALKYHPDLNQESGAKEKFQQITEAYHQIIDRNDFKRPSPKQKNHSHTVSNFDLYRILKKLQLKALKIYRTLVWSIVSDQDLDLKAFAQVTKREIKKDDKVKLEFEQVDHLPNGEVQREIKKIAVKLPVGFKSNQIIRLRGLGQVSQDTGEVGDLLLRIRIQ